MAADDAPMPSIQDVLVVIVFATHPAWRFALESALLAGIRTALLKAGLSDYPAGWGEAQQLARETLRVTFDRLGVKRPTDEQTSGTGHHRGPLSPETRARVAQQNRDRWRRIKGAAEALPSAAERKVGKMRRKRA